MTAPRKLLSLPEAAGRLGCSRNHVLNLVTAGLLTRYDIASPGSKKTKTRVSDADVDRYIADAARPVRTAS